ncbi:MULTISPECIES: hypothetical protein [Amycolatopsis]|nr:MULTISPECIES: hypothetical protein [Amycolatopsis]
MHTIVVTGRTQPTPWWDWYTTRFEERHARLRAMWNRQQGG